MSNTLKGKITIFFLSLIGVYFIVNMATNIIYINTEKRSDLRILLSHALNESYDYVKKNREKTNLNFLYNVPHMTSVLTKSGARGIEFFFTQQEYEPNSDEIAVSLQLDNGYYFNLKSNDREIRRHIYESIVVLLVRDVAFLLVIGLTGVYFIHRMLLPLSHIANQCQYYKDGNRFYLNGKNIGSEIRQLETSLNMLVDRFSDLRKKDKIYFKQATHELKTPLAIIKARVDSYSENESIPKETFINEINGDIERLYLEIKSILYFNIFDFDREEKFSVLGEITNAIDSVKILLQSRLLTVDIQGDDFYLKTRKNIFIKMFMAIFENAIIYAKSDSTIYIVLGKYTLVVTNTQGNEINLFSSKLGTKILEKLSQEIHFTFDISKDDDNYKVSIYFDKNDSESMEK